MSKDKPYIVNGEYVTLEEYRKTKYEDIRVRAPIGQKAIIKEAAEVAEQSLNEFILQSIAERMERMGIAPSTEPKD